MISGAFQHTGLNERVFFERYRKGPGFIPHGGMRPSLLGALLAVPLTATLKVLLKRYFWDRDPSLTARL